MPTFMHEAVMLDLHRLITSVIKAAPLHQASPSSPDTRVYKRVWRWPNDKRMPHPLSFELTVTGPSASLRMDFTNLDGIPGTDGHVAILGGEGVARRWMVRCPQSGKMVQRLYLVPGADKFRSRHAAQLVYTSKSRSELERLEARGHKLMRELGCTGWEGGPRLKGMRNEKYQRLKKDLQETHTRWLHVALDLPLPETDEEIEALESTSRAKVERASERASKKDATTGDAFEITKDGIRKRTV